jgi:hypothetical protein
MTTKPRKKKIAAALREQVWLASMGEQFKAKCTVTWCSNQVTVFNFQCGHLLAESKGGPTVLENLRPICSRCNQSMGTMHMDQWLQLGGGGAKKSGWWRSLFQCFGSSGAANECTPAK